MPDVVKHVRLSLLWNVKMTLARPLAGCPRGIGTGRIYFETPGIYYLCRVFLFMIS